METDDNQVRAGGPSYTLRPINRSEAEGVVLLAIQSTDLLLDLDVVNILSFPIPDIKQMKLTDLFFENKST